MGHQEGWPRAHQPVAPVRCWRAYILGFEVTIHDALLVYVRQREDKLGSVELTPGFRKGRVVFQVREQVATAYIP